MKLGIGFTPLENRHEVVLRFGVLADELGYDYLALAEGWAYDSTHILAEVARRTSRISLIAGVLSVWGRSAGMIAMTAGTLHHLSGGRFILGLGASTKTLTEGLHDVDFSDPAERLRTVTTQVRTLLAGERIPHAEREGVRPLKLGMEPAPEVPIYLAAMSPGTMRVVGEVADGWLPYLISAEELAGAAADMERHRPAHRRSLRLLPGVFAAAADEKQDEARRLVARTFVMYLMSMGEVYPRIARDQGWSAELEAIERANERPRNGIVPPEAEGFLRAYNVYGTPDDLSAQLNRWSEAGADGLIVSMPPGAPEPAIERTMRALAPRDRDGRKPEEETGPDS